MSLLEEVRIIEAYERMVEKHIFEGIKVDNLPPESKDAFKKIQSGKAKKIAVSSMDKTKLYWDVNGTTWLTTQRDIGNKGSTKDFLKDVKAKKIKANLVEGKKDCPDGHEWDEKMQECLPASTGIKEKKKDCPEGHEWDEKMQECLPASTGIKEEELDEGMLPKGSKYINTRLAYIKDKQGNISVWEKSKKGWSEWWLMDPATFKREFGKIA